MMNLNQNIEISAKHIIFVESYFHPGITKIILFDVAYLHDKTSTKQVVPNEYSQFRISGFAITITRLCNTLQI